MGLEGAGTRRRPRQGCLGAGRSRTGQGLPDHREAGAPHAHRRTEEGPGGIARHGRRRQVPAAPGHRRTRPPRIQHRPSSHHRGRAAHRRSRHAHGAQDHRRDGRAAAHARFGAVHARRNAGAGHDHARHRPRRADHRRPRGRAQRAVHAPLQLPAVLGGRDGHDGFAEAPRNRPRQPGPPWRVGSDAGHDDVPVHHPHRVRDHSSRTARARWPRSAAPASR